MSFPVKNRLRSSAIEPQAAAAQGSEIGNGAAWVWSSVMFFLRSREDGVDSGTSVPRRRGARDAVGEVIDRYENSVKPEATVQRATRRRTQGRVGLARRILRREHRADRPCDHAVHADRRLHADAQ